MRKIILIICIFVIQYSTAQVAKYSNEFLNVGVSARALAMSNANIASVNDVSAGYWNPAGLLFQQSNLQLGLMHAEYFAGIAKYDYIAAAKRIDSNSVACLSFIRFGVDNIPNTLDLVDANGNVSGMSMSSCMRISSHQIYALSSIYLPKFDPLSDKRRTPSAHHK